MGALAYSCKPYGDPYCSCKLTRIIRWEPAKNCAGCRSKITAFERASQQQQQQQRRQQQQRQQEQRQGQQGGQQQGGQPAVVKRTTLVGVRCAVQTKPEQEPQQQGQQRQGAQQQEQRRGQGQQQPPPSGRKRELGQPAASPSDPARPAKHHRPSGRRGQGLTRVEAPLERGPGGFGINLNVHCKAVG